MDAQRFLSVVRGREDEWLNCYEFYPEQGSRKESRDKFMKRVKLVVAYDGTNYCGWQLQPNGVTIEEVLNRALTELLREPIMVIGASRTDSGVHARGNVAVFDTENRMPADKICFALNQRLPEDIRIQSSEEVPLSWHPRKANCIKTYEYKILNRKIAMPLERLYSHFCYFPLDVEKCARVRRIWWESMILKAFAPCVPRRRRLCVPFTVWM